MSLLFQRHVTRQLLGKLSQQKLLEREREQEEEQPQTKRQSILVVDPSSWSTRIDMCEFSSDIKAEIKKLLGLQFGDYVAAYPMGQDEYLWYTWGNPESRRFGYWLNMGGSEPVFTISIVSSENWGTNTIWNNRTWQDYAERYDSENAGTFSGGMDRDIMIKKQTKSIQHLESEIDVLRKEQRTAIKSLQDAQTKINRLEKNRSKLISLTAVRKNERPTKPRPRN